MALLLPAFALGGKPSQPESAAPQVAYYDLSKIYVCNQDGSSKTILHENRYAQLRSPKMAPDHQSVYFVEWAPNYGTTRIRRTTFSVVGGSVVPGVTETIVETPLSIWEVALSPAGDKLTFVNGALFELPICASPPCSLAGAVALYTPPADRWIEPIGGYSANGRAYFFHENGEGASFRPEILRLDLLGAGPPFAAELVLTMPTDQQGITRFVQPGPVDQGGVESRLLYNYYDKLYIYETWSDEPVELVGRHAAATWASADESAIIAVTILRGTNWLQGPLDRLDATGRIVAPIAKWGAAPDWR